jgi:hypothetical protein
MAAIFTNYRGIPIEYESTYPAEERLAALWAIDDSELDTISRDPLSQAATFGRLDKQICRLECWAIQEDGNDIWVTSVTYNHKFIFGGMRKLIDYHKKTDGIVKCPQCRGEIRKIIFHAPDNVLYSCYYVARNFFLNVKDDFYEAPLFMRVAIITLILCIIILGSLFLSIGTYNCAILVGKHIPLITDKVAIAVTSIVNAIFASFSFWAMWWAD